MDILSKLQPPEGAVTKETRFGRGPGSGLGKTAGRGQKGQKARSSGNINKRHFQGGQTPLYRRLPKRGFKNTDPIAVATVNVGALQSFAAGAVVDIDALRAKKLVRGQADMIKILAGGDISKGLTVHAHKFSQAAREKIEKAGGKVVLLPALGAPEAPKS